MSLLLAGAIDTSVLLLLAFAVMPFLRRQPAALRHLVFAAALISGTLLPLVAPALPRWQVLVQLTPSVGRPVPVLGVARTSVESTPSEETAPVRSEGESSPLGLVLARTWMLGAAAMLVALLLGFARLIRLGASSRRITKGRWLDQAESISRELGLRRSVMLLESRDPRLLVVWGLVRPRVLLPAHAGEWPDARVRMVLAHELAHVRRADWLVQCVAELLRALYWFNPLVWAACTRLRQESDRACDDVVINRGDDGSDYAAHLVEIARLLRQPRAWTPAAAMAHTSGFEQRVQAMLNTHVNRRPLSRFTSVITLVGCVVAAIPLAGLTAAQTALATFTGSVVDPQNAVLPNAAITLTNVETQAKYEVRTNRDGRYEIPGVPAGRYVLESRVPGFATLKMELTVAGQNVDRELKLDIGTIQETITLTAGPGAQPPKPMDPATRARMEEQLRKRAAIQCPDRPAAPGPPIGGNIRQPAKLRDVRPVYPAELAAAETSGRVMLDALIGTDGSVQDVKVVSTSHPAFAAAASDAVRQWQFDATLLNCVPVETRMNVTVNFTYQP